MENKNRRPVVYVARKITHYGVNNQEVIDGYYVSKAYLNFAGKWYEKDGMISKEFKVDFLNYCELLTIEQKCEFETDFHAEQDVNISKKYASNNYADCKKYVDVQNRKLHNIIKPFSAVDVEKRMEFHKQALKYGEMLEEKYIPLEEREQVSESAKNI